MHILSILSQAVHGLIKKLQGLRDLLLRGWLINGRSSYQIPNIVFGELLCGRGAVGRKGWYARKGIGK